MNNIQIEQHGLVCDNANCDWQDQTIILENYKEWINKPCPKCGENILTQEDYENAQQIVSAMNIVNSLSQEQIADIVASVDFEVLKQTTFLKDAEGLNSLNKDNEIVSVVVNTHKDLKITEIKKE